jgi:thiamine kinase-like enzyme
MPWSKVSLFKTPKGLVYLKQMAAPFAIEPKILQFMHKNFSTAVTEVLAINEQLSCFLMKDAGQVLRDIQKQNFQTQLFYNALKTHAQIQIASVPFVESFILMSVNDWRLKKLANLYGNFVAREHLLEAAGVNKYEIEMLQNFSPQMQILCEQLSAYNIPETIEHNDFQDNNILIQDDRITINDWGDACISHPFLSLATALNSAKRNHNFKKTDSRYLQAQNAYLEIWLDYGTIDELRKAFLIAEKLSYFQFSLSFSRIESCVSVEEFSLYSGYMSEALRDFLHKVQG